ncbi:MAG: hypothetical protein CM1200mP20_15770 [Pseudomonadota bacterium]|nr:MAG: hypothetical protein CM1200mP20_15770 [Pseudomonadota bacterium]
MQANVRLHWRISSSTMVARTSSRGEFVVSVIVPLENRYGSTAGKSPSDSTGKFAAVLGAFAMQIDGGRVRQARISFGGMAAIPRRAHHCEAALKGAATGPQTLTQARDALERDFEPISDLRASSGYRQRVAGNLLEKAAVDDGAQPSELYDDVLASGPAHG